MLALIMSRGTLFGNSFRFPVLYSRLSIFYFRFLEGNLSTKTIGLILFVIGILITAFVLLASPLGILGTSFGLKHVLGLIVGLVVLVAGGYMSFVKKPV